MNNDIEMNLNNGGKTSYYDLPLPKLGELVNSLDELLKRGESFLGIAKKISELFPQTLNDLIEFKEMKPWQHEVMKACYAINERAKKNGGSELREINKIIYYANRRKNQLLKDLK